ncbi:MAG: signal recognition particle-docking protein FtsY [Hoeflea sp.]|uniref:signal recognition particle-docking protein FtsY n=1 Tax=Hoeflea sp. TaxID=1940281 RepID=UPI002731B6CB|nr:signal recognition particle-docking protein FtsY [Hoeflea sp.]MDP2120007.1 signal recognition particle-docking protein FtsY [Hoeflea sp.]
MALNFIKKVFSFGRTTEAAPVAPTEPDQTTAADDAAPREIPAQEPAPQAVTVDEGTDPDQLSADPGIAPAPVDAPASAPEPELPLHAFPRDGAMQFTPETAETAALSTPAPADKTHAGEPPIPAAPEDDHAESVTEHRETDEGMAPEDLTADPGLAPAPETPPVGAAPIAIEPVQAPEPEPEPRRLVVRGTVSRAEPEQAPAVAQQEPAGWWTRLRQGLSRTSGQLTGQISGIFTKRKLDADTLQDLEDVLLQADLGVETAMRITDALAASRYGKDISPADVQKVMAGEITKVLAPVARPLELDLSHKPHVILVVGVNGTGKTTTIGKLAAKLSAGGLKVTLAAGDTFRAAAIEQLKIWGERTGSKVVSTRIGADAAGLAYEAFETARVDGADVLIIDTAGRLQNRTELMDELAKVVRVIGKLDPDAPHTVLQTLDATTGQNALNQVEIFKNVAGVNGLVMTKLDGTARGGILVAIAARHKLPVYFVGVGEGIDDLEPFEAADFASAIAGEPK